MAQPTYLPGTQIIPFMGGTKPPAPTGQIVPSSRVGPKPAQVLGVRTINPVGLPGTTAQPSAPKLSTSIANLASNVFKGGLISGLATPNVMGDATISGAYGEAMKDRIDLFPEDAPRSYEDWVRATQMASQPMPTAPTAPSIDMGADVAANTVMAPPTAPQEDFWKNVSPEALANLAPQDFTPAEKVRAGIAAPPQSVTQQEFQQMSRSAQETLTSPVPPVTMFPARDMNPLTTVGGAPLKEYLQGGIQLDPQGRMIPSGFASRAEAFPEYEKEAAALQQRINQRADFGKAVSDRERRGTGEMSMADAVDMAGGDRKLARAMIVRQRQGLDPMTSRPADQRTPEEVEQDKLQNERLRQIIDQGNQPQATKLQQRRGQLAEALQDGIITQAQFDDQLKREVLGNPPQGYDTWAQYESDTGQDVDGDGKVGGDSDSTGATSDVGAEPTTSTTFDPKKLKGQDKSAYEWAQANKGDPRAEQILQRLGAQ